MKTLWTFGDSQTFGYGCRPDGPLTEYYNKYKKDGDDIWPVLLSNKLEMNLVNLGSHGVSNDYILDSMMEAFNDINEGDYVILGKTYHQRFDVKFSDRNIVSNIIAEFPEHKIKKLQIEGKENLKVISTTNEEYETLVNFTYLFAQDVFFKKRQDKRFTFLKERLINERKIEKFHEWVIYDKIFNSVEKINKHTRYTINDFHFSFNGHKVMCDYFYNKLTFDYSRLL